MKPFTRDTRAPRLVFGNGAVDQVGAEAERLWAQRVLLICGDALARLRGRVELSLGTRLADTWTEIRQHVPVDLADRAAAKARELAADLVVTVGGGSTTGLGKAVALRTGLPLLAVPTTYAGSEMTTIWGQSADGAKTTGRNPLVLPRTVVYDPSLLLGLPPAVVGPSGMNALAHCAEAMYAPQADPLSTLIAVEGARLLISWLPTAYGRPGQTGPPDSRACAQVLWASCLAGHALNTAGSSLHHALCHLLGGRHDLPHAETHGVVLPHVLRFVLPACADHLAPLADALDTPVEQLPQQVWDLGRKVGTPVGLRSLGLGEASLPGIATALIAKHPPSPRPLTTDDAYELLRACWSGEPPDAPASLTPPGHLGVV
ncbi:Maleylacetate reductase [Frankia sp. Hr75.2]|nr:Maleylacetate reductase [Frankia sp. Hr75.2]